MREGGVSVRYGIKIDGILVATYDTPEEAYDNGRFCYDESGYFHEVVAVISSAKGLDDR